jgi:hypothetical protein
VATTNWLCPSFSTKIWLFQSDSKVYDNVHVKVPCQYPKGDIQADRNVTSTLCFQSSPEVCGTVRLQPAVTTEHRDHCSINNNPLKLRLDVITIDWVLASQNHIRNALRSPIKSLCLVSQKIPVPEGPGQFASRLTWSDPNPLHFAHNQPQSMN